MGKTGRYLASLPERATRAGVALAGGTVYEVSQVALPRVVRGSRLYQATVARLLRILVELVGGVEGVYPAEAISVRELMARKTAGNVVEAASILAMGWSPLWFLAAASDLAGGSKAYLRELVDELAEAKLIQEGSDVASFEDLLGRLEAGSGVLADAVDVPPLKVADARASWERLRDQADELPSADDLGRIFDDLRDVARREDRSVAELSAAVGLAAARAGLDLGSVHLVDYYRDALGAIRDEGLLAFLGRVARPYRRRTGRHFDPKAPTQTDRLLDWIGARRAGKADRPDAAAGSSAVAGAKADGEPNAEPPAAG